MSTIISPAPPRAIVYPDDDGQPMSENTWQFQWIVTIEGGLDALYRDDPNVFVAGDLLWYPVEGDNTIRTAPDAMIAFGRPKRLPRFLPTMGRGRSSAAGGVRGSFSRKPKRR